MGELNEGTFRVAKWLCIGLAVVSAWWFKDYATAGIEAGLAVALIALGRSKK